MKHEDILTDIHNITDTIVSAAMEMLCDEKKRGVKSEITLVVKAVTEKFGFKQLLVYQVVSLYIEKSNEIWIKAGRGGGVQWGERPVVNKT